MSLSDDLEAEVGPVKPKLGPKKNTGNNNHSGESWFDIVNAVDTGAVLDALDVEHDDKRVKCPGCGEGMDGTDVALVEGGYKCSHDRCANKGKNGFRTNVDVACEVLNKTPQEAVLWLAEKFNIDLRQTQTSTDDGEGAKQPLWGDGGPKEDHGRQHEAAPVASSIDDAIELVRRRQSGEDAPIPMPFPDYSAAIDGGLYPGLQVLISTTGGLKTQLASQQLLHAAQQGIPCLFVSLELSKPKVTIRLLAQLAYLSWSRAMKGQFTDEQFQAFKNARTMLATLPIEIKTGKPYVYSSADLSRDVDRFRTKHPTGRAFVVVDFVQLMKCDEAHAETRERVGRVIYDLQVIAEARGLVITAISSTARANNSLLLTDIKRFANLKFEDGKKIVGNPWVLLSLGKEAGEIELGSEYQLVIAKWPTKLDNGQEVNICAFAKYRLNHCRWFAVYADHGRLVEFPCESWDDLPKLPDPPKGAIKEATPPDKIEQAILDYVDAHPGEVTCKTGFRQYVTGTNGEVDAGAARLIARNAIVKGPRKGFVRPPEVESAPSAERESEQLSLLDGQNGQECN